jgi:hypothetical protein
MRNDELEAYVDAASAALGLQIDAAHRPGVVHYLGLAAAMADLVMATPLAVDAEPAAVFVPIGPEDAGGAAAPPSP